MGHLNGVSSYYKRQYLYRFINQILEKPDGPVYYSFKRPYEFGSFMFAYGGSTMSGKFRGSLKTLKNGKRRVLGTGKFTFYDVFTDPVSIRQWLYREYPELSKLPKSLQSMILKTTDGLGKAYTIHGEWEQDFDMIM